MWPIQTESCASVFVKLDEADMFKSGQIVAKRLPASASAKFQGAERVHLVLQ
jgi:hypothetical protein